MYTTPLGTKIHFYNTMLLHYKEQLMQLLFLMIVLQDTQFYKTHFVS